MELPAQVEGWEGLALPPGRPVHLAIGMFDGVHRGHRAVIDPTVQAARASGGIAAALTFWPHPSAVLRPQQAVPLLQDASARGRRLLAAGLDLVVTQPFTRVLAALPAAEFVPSLRRSCPALAGLSVGENFRFGQGRAGDAAFLLAAGREAGLAINIAPRLIDAGEPVSSTRIRALVAEGKMAAANRLLGYAYEAVGVVTPGKQLGRTIGFPTLNVPWEPGLRPALGVYAVTIRRAGGGPVLPAVANYGLRPTVERTSAPRLEVHVLGACDLGPGEQVVVEWLSFLRPEQTFPDLGALRVQIARDRDAAAAYFAAGIR